MRSRIFFTGLLVSVACILGSPTAATAHPGGVGLGVAAGGVWSPSEVENGTAKIDVGSGRSWGFFVDIPLIETFYIAPAAMLYEVDFGEGRQPVTDIDLNFKFIVPMGPMRLGAGVLAGLSNGVVSGDDSYTGHYGLLGYFSYSLVANLDGFAMLQYKRLQRAGVEVDLTHGYLGGMFRF